MRSLTSTWLRLVVALALVVGASAGAGAQEQGAVISGRVTAESGAPVGGAAVVIPSLNVGTLANEAGAFRLVVSAARTRGQTVAITARFIGFRPSSRQITLTPGPQTVNFSLPTDVNRLNEVVVTGVTGATERALVPFSVSRVDTSEMRVVAVNPLTQLQGKVPGANIVSNSGRPGSQPAVLLRGPTSINAYGRSQDPLYIVDGVILSGPLPDLNPQDIESIEVVKGAAAGTLYGSQAAAGVIQITTKSGRGARNGVRFGFRSELGVNGIERDFGVARNHALLLSGDQTRFCVVDAATSSRACSRTIDYLQEQARINSVPGDTAATPPSFPIDPGSTMRGDILRRTFSANRYPGKNFNPVEQFVDPRPLVMNNVDVTGRAGETNFFASLNNTRQGGAIRFLNGYNRNSGRLNVGSLLGSQWDLRLNTYYSRSTQDGFNQEEGGRSFFRLTRTPAIVDLTQRDALGRLYIRPNLQNGGVQNENALYWLENVDRQDVRDRFLGGGTLRYKPLEWLDFEGNASFDRSTLDFRQFRNRGFRVTNADPTTSGGFLFNGSSNAQSYNGYLQGSVRRSLLGEDLHSRLNLRVLYQQADNDFRNLQGTQLRISDVDAAPNIQDQKVLNSGRVSQRQLSYSAGLNLEYKERYVLDGLVRRDGSSLFGADNRWQTYGRASASWLIAREPWWITPKVSQLTVRGSVGSAGQTPNYTAQYETYTIGAGGTVNPLTLGNRLLRPEVKVEQELGIDLELFGRYGLQSTFANSNINNQILPVPVPAGTGFLQQWQNAGTLNNKTLELSLIVPFVRGRDLNWSGRFNYATNRPTVTKLNVPPFFLGTDLQATNNFIRIAEGERYGNIYGRKFITSCGDLPGNVAARCGPGKDFQRNNEGYVVFVGAGHTPDQGITDNLWETYTDINWATSGTPVNRRANWGMPIILRDSTGGGRIVNLGNALPTYQASFSQNFSFKRFSAYTLLDASVGQHIWNQSRHWSYLDFLGGEVDQGGKSVGDAKPLGYFYRSNVENPNGLGGFYDLLQPNSRFVEDASYAKIREVTASYHVGQIAGSGDWTFSITGRNLKTFTNYKGFDPEIGVGSQTTDLATANFNNAGSGVINAIDAFSFPNLRTFTFSLSTSF
jgi:TonB-linked SusC/RagA family outer membrane protein